MARAARLPRTVGFAARVLVALAASVLVPATTLLAACGAPEETVRAPTTAKSAALDAGGGAVPTGPPDASTTVDTSLHIVPARSVVTAVVSGPSPRDWIAAVPARAVAAKVGDLVWAAFAAGDEVRIEPCVVRAITATGASLVADDHSVHDNVSGALITKAVDTESLHIGDLVTYFDWRRDLGIALVTKRDVYRRLNIKFRDSDRVVRQEPVHVAQPFPSTVTTLAWVSFPYPGGPDPRPAYRGLVFADLGDTLLVRDDANRAWIIPRAGLRLLAVSAKPRAVGDNVVAYEYGTGYRAGTIQSIFDPNYAYGVARDGDDATKSFYFSELVDAL